MNDHARNFSIDIWRGVAICAVLVLHAWALTPGSNPHSWMDTVTNSLGLGVHLFFLLSGYLISESWDRCSTGGAQEFLVRRLAKIAPLYYIFLGLWTCAFLVAAAIGDPTTFNRGNIGWTAINPANYVIHFLFLQGLVPSSLNSLSPGSWSIVNEMYFYMLYPLIRRFVATSLNKTVLLWAVAVLTEGLMANYASDYGTQHGYGVYNFYYFLTAFPDFCLGMIIYWSRRQPILELPPTTMAVAAAMLFVSIVWYRWGWLVESGIFIPLIAPLVAIARWPSNPLTKVLRLYGRQTYAVYFVHLFSLMWFDNLVLIPLQGHFQYSERLAINLAIALPWSLLVSNFAFDRIDRYFLRRIVNAYLAWKAKGAPTYGQRPSSA